jgi:hypothetical protein
MAASLTNIAITSRKAIRYGVYFVIAYFIGRMALNISLTVYRTFFPKPPPPPTVAFGPVPKLPFPERKDLPQFEYKVETPSGGLPSLDQQAKVYYMPPSAATLNSFENAKAKARGLGFTTDPEEITPTNFRFKHPTAASILEMNIVNNTFSISYNLASDPLPLDKQPPAEQSAVSVARGYIGSASLTPPDLDGPTSTEFLKVDSQGLSTVVSLSEANLIKVSLFRKDYDNLSAKTPDPRTGNVWFILSGESGSGRQIIASEFHYFPIDKTQVATYPLKTAAAALEDLKAGNGFIASLGSNPDGKVTIRRIYLAYYDPGVYTQFYQPIVVFEGDRNFVAYVPAVQSSYYGK